MQAAARISHPIAEAPREPTAPAASIPRVSRSKLARLDAAPVDGIATLEGTLPDWLRGRLVRTAPAVFQEGPWQARHWFDGLGMVYAFALESSDRVTWRERLLATEAAAHVRNGRLPVATFGSPIERSFWRRLIEPVPRVTDNANVNVVKIGDDWVAMTESPHPLAIDGTTLATKGRVTYDDDLPAGLVMTAHPHFDRARNLVVNLGFTLGRVAEVIAYAHEPGSRSRRAIARFSSAELPYLHSFGLTAEEVLVVGHPWIVRPASLLWSNRAFADHFQWKQEKGTEIVVLGRQGERGRGRDGVTARYEVESMFVFHTVNAFRDGDERVLDVLAYPNADIVAALSTERMAQGLPSLRPRLRRIRMAANGRATVETLGTDGFEFPAIHYRQTSGRRHRYVWGSAASGDGKDVTKIDGETGLTRSWGASGYVFGEPVFVANPAGQSEDDGVLLVVGSTETRAMLAVLDARTLDPIALAHIDTPIPLGFHGSFARTPMSAAASH